MTSRAEQALLDELFESPLPGARYAHDVVSRRLPKIEQEVRDEIRARVEALRKDDWPRREGRGVAFREAKAANAAWNLAIDAAVAAISSSSATETQDGERGECLAVIPPDESIQFCMKPEGHEGPHGATETQDGEWEHGEDDGVSAHGDPRFETTETQDGERPGLRAIMEIAFPVEPWQGVEVTTESYQPDDECGWCQMPKPRLKKDRGPDAHAPDCLWVKARAALTPATPDDRDREAWTPTNDEMSRLLAATHNAGRLTERTLTPTPDDRDREVERIALPVIARLLRGGR